MKGTLDNRLAALRALLGGSTNVARNWERTMTVIIPLLLALAFLSFALGAFGVTSRVNLVAAGLALWVLSALLSISR
jgi:hypothetical protein